MRMQSGHVLALVLVAGLQAGNTSASGVTSGPQIPVIAQAGFAMCPAFAGGQVLERFDEKSWPAHLEIAVAQPNELKQWSVNFATDSVLRYTLGNRPSLGYRVKLSPPVTKDADTLMIPVLQTEPKPGQLTASALSSPCLYLHLDGNQFSDASVVDAKTGKVIESLRR